MKPYTEIFAALLTPTIAVITTYIAIQQYRNNRLKHRLDLYDRRMAIYKAVTAYISALTSGLEPDTKAEKEAFAGHIQESYFLFNKEIYEYLGLINFRAMQIEITRLAASADLPDENNWKAKADENKLWLSQQLAVLQKKFSPYLKLEAMK